MKRREALNRVAALMGTAISAPTMIALLEGCTTKDAASSTFGLTPDYRALVAQFAEIIIPTTDTPGAKDAGVGPLIETMLKDCYTEAQGQHFIKGLEMVEEKSKALGGSFVSLSSEQQTEIVKAMEQAAKDEETKKKEAMVIDAETGKEKATDKGEEMVPFFRLMKELTVFGYFSSEPGMTQALDYVPIPGRWDACIPLKEGQKAYALG